MSTQKYYVSVSTSLLEKFENYLIQNKYEFILMSTNFRTSETLLMYSIVMDAQDAVKLRLTFDIAGMLDEKVLWPNNKNVN